MISQQTKLDALDYSILAHLVENARLSNVELAELVGLSPSACSRRIAILQASGVIDGYEARLNVGKLGGQVTVLVSISLKGQSETDLHNFEQAVTAIPNVIVCYLMSGAADYLLRVVARDMADFARLHSQHLSRLPGVDRINSNFALREVVNRPYLMRT